MRGMEAQPEQQEEQTKEKEGTKEKMERSLCRLPIARNLREGNKDVGMGSQSEALWTLIGRRVQEREKGDKRMKTGRKEAREVRSLEQISDAASRRRLVASQTALLTLLPWHLSPLPPPVEPPTRLALAGA